GRCAARVSEEHDVRAHRARRGLGAGGLHLRLAGGLGWSWTAPRALASPQPARAGEREVRARRSLDGALVPVHRRRPGRGGWLGRTVAYLDAAFDKYVVDGAVNGLGSLTWNSGRALRRVQTGHIQAYLYGALGGSIAFLIIQYVIR